MAKLWYTVTCYHFLFFIHKSMSLKEQSRYKPADTLDCYKWVSFLSNHNHLFVCHYLETDFKKRWSFLLQPTHYLAEVDWRATKTWVKVLGNLLKLPSFSEQRKCITRWLPNTQTSTPFKAKEQYEKTKRQMNWWITMAILSLFFFLIHHSMKHWLAVSAEGYYNVN